LEFVTIRGIFKGREDIESLAIGTVLTFTPAVDYNIAFRSNRDGVVLVFIAER